MNKEKLCAMAAENGVGRPFLLLWQAAEKHGMHPRLYATSVMFAPPTNGTRMLFTAWVKPRRRGLVKTYIGPDAFAEFYPVTAAIAKRYLGDVGWRDMTEEDVSVFIAGLDRLFETINSR